MIGCMIIHGYTGGPHEVAPLATYLEQHTDWHVNVPTLPGHGRDIALDNVTYEEWLNKAEGTLKQMQEKFDAIYVIGFSMGGMIAVYLAARHPVDKLVLLAPAGKYLSLRQIMKDVKGVAKDGLKGKLGQNNMYLHYKKKWGTVPLKANIEFLKLVRVTRGYLSKVTSPVLIAQGQQDMMVPYQTPYYLDKEITSKQKEVVLFERSTHMLCLGDDKDTLNMMIHDFLGS